MRGADSCSIPQRRLDMPHYRQRLLSQGCINFFARAPHSFDFDHQVRSHSPKSSNLLIAPRSFRRSICQHRLLNPMLNSRCGFLSRETLSAAWLCVAVVLAMETGLGFLLYWALSLQSSYHLHLQMIRYSHGRMYSASNLLVFCIRCG